MKWTVGGVRHRLSPTTVPHSHPALPHLCTHPHSLPLRSLPTAATLSSQQLHPSAHDAGYGVDGASVGVPSSVAGLSMDRRGRDRSTKSHRKKEQARSLFSLLRRMSLGKASDPGSDTADEIEREVRCVTPVTCKGYA